MDRTLERIWQLAPGLRLPAFHLIWWLRVQGYPAVITSARRTPAEQSRLVAEGRSKTMRSKHLTGDAFDLGFAGYVPDDVPVAWWDYAEAVGRHLGLVRPISWDRPHYERA